MRNLDIFAESRLTPPSPWSPLLGEKNHLLNDKHALKYENMQKLG